VPERNRRLLVAMAEMGCSSRKLAAETGMAESSISNILNYQIQPRPETQLRIAEALDTTVAQLFEGDE